MRLIWTAIASHLTAAPANINRHLMANGDTKRQQFMLEYCYLETLRLRCLLSALSGSTPYFLKYRYSSTERSTSVS